MISSHGFAFLKREEENVSNSKELQNKITRNFTTFLSHAQEKRHTNNISSTLLCFTFTTHNAFKKDKENALIHSSLPRFQHLQMSFKTFYFFSELIN
jgi:hypothetical protein